MDPRTARSLTIPEAMFYIAGERSVKLSCKKMNRLSHFGRDVTADDIRKSHADYMTHLRKAYTGTEELILTENELKQGVEEPLTAYF